MILCLSSPRGQRGVFYRLFQQAREREDGYALHLPTWEMNPVISKAFLEREQDRDPELFAQEYEASFTAIGGAFISGTSLSVATRPIPEHAHGRRVLAIDPAFSQDDFGLAVACFPDQPDGLVYLEYVDVMKRPGFNEAMDHVAALAKKWQPFQVITDQMSMVAVMEELPKRGVTCWGVPWTGRSNAGRSKHHRYGELKRLLAQEKLILPDNADLRSQLTDITVSPSAVDPGYSIETHGPDDMADAAVMAITEKPVGGFGGIYL